VQSNQRFNCDTARGRLALRHSSNGVATRAHRTRNTNLRRRHAA
jgi:hypothetical protein